MSKGTQIAEADWSAPATKGELRLVQSDLTGKIDKVAADLNRKIDKVAADLNGKIDVGLKSVELGVFRMIWIAAGALTAVGVLLRFW